MSATRTQLLTLRAVAGALLATTTGVAASPLLFSQAGGSAFLRNTPGGRIISENNTGTGSASVDEMGSDFSYDATVTTQDTRNKIELHSMGCDTCTPEVVASASGLSRITNGVLLPAGQGAGSVSASIKLSGTIDDARAMFYEFVFDAGDELSGSFTNNVSFLNDSQGTVDEMVMLAFDYTYNFSSPTEVLYESELSASGNGNLTATLMNLTVNGMPIVEQPEEDGDEKVKLVLDWENPIPREFQVMTDASTLAQFVVPTPGEEPTLNSDGIVSASAFNAFQQSVEEKLAAIFEASDIPLEILGPGDPGAAEALTVRFASEKPYLDADGALALLYGMAYDVGPFTLPVVDRFNTRDEGEVAVFVDLEVQTPEFVAKTVAHEAGHGFGLRHVNPDGAASLAVLDYDQTEGETEQFTDVIANILEPPDAMGSAGLFGTHNPVYHLRRYGLDESHETLAGEGVNPGTWDVDEYEITQFNVADIVGAGAALGQALYNVTALSDLGAGAAGIEQPRDVLGFLPVVDLQDFTGIEFLSTADFPFHLVASSTPGAVWDLIFGFGDPTAPRSLFDPASRGPLAGTIFRSLGPGLGFEAVGSFRAGMTLFATASADGSVRLASAPEPGVLGLLALGLGWVGLARRRRSG